MNRTTHYSEEISQTALALLALVAAGKSLDAATVLSVRSLLNSQNDSCENRVNLTIFSEQDDESGNTEVPVIIPFSTQNSIASYCHNGYGTLSLKNRTTPQRDSGSWLRIFSPDATGSTDDEKATCLATTAKSLKIYAE